MRRRFSDDPDNPAWPGLVDLFAFGMVIMVVLWVGAKSRDTGTMADARTELAQAKARIIATEAELSVLRHQLEAYQSDSTGSQPQQIIQREQRKATLEILDRLREVFGEHGRR